MTTTDTDEPRARRLVVATWRDRWNPDAGGAEVWLDEVVTRLARRGWSVTVLTMVDPGRPRDEVVDGVTYRRRGGRLTQYLRAHVSRWRIGPPDVVLDVFNGVPFLSVLTTRRPVVVVVHHVHREQWGMVFGRLVARAGWTLERWGATRQAGCHHVTVSDASARALASTYGVPAGRIAVAHNGTTPPPAVPPPVALVPAERRLVVVGRLVPHKRVEVAVRAVAAARRAGIDAHLDVVGEGEWHDDLAAAAAEAGVARHVTFHGRVDEATKHAVLAAADLHVLASVREGWGIVVTEAGRHGVPTVARRSAGGTTESVLDGRSGELAADDDDLVVRVLALLRDDDRRTRLGAGARDAAERHDWDHTADVVAATLVAAVAERPAPDASAGSRRRARGARPARR